MAFKMKNSALMNKARMAGDNRSAYKHLVEVGPTPGTQAPNAKGAYTHNKAHRDKKFDMNHQLISKDEKKEGTKKDSPMKDGHYHETLDEVVLKPRKVSKMIADSNRPGKKNVNYNLDDKGRWTGRFETNKRGKRKRKDYMGDPNVRGDHKSGGGFVNRLRKEGLESAIMNTLPARFARSVKQGVKSVVNYPERHRDTHF